jgi:hypothetical protein
VKIDISTVIKQDDFVLGFNHGSMTIESKYGWICPGCGEYIHDFIKEVFSFYNNMAHREVVITRNWELPEDWLCDECRGKK